MVKILKRHRVNLQKFQINIKTARRFNQIGIQQLRYKGIC